MLLVTYYNVSYCVWKLSNVNGDDSAELDSHLAQVPIKLTTFGVDHETKQAILIIMSFFTRKLGPWAQLNIEALYSLNFVSQLLEFVRSSFVVQDYQDENLQLLIKIEQKSLDVSDYIRKFNDS